MALQSESALSMTTLGITGDTPVDPLQPPLVDAIHLRWAFGASRSFPWYGYYLFRRPSRTQREEVCVAGYLRNLGPPAGSAPIPQSLNSTSHITPIGTFTSDRILQVTDEFPAPGFGEMDLRDRAFLRFTCVEPASRIHYRVGLRQREGGGELTCVRFSTVDVSNSSNPRVKDGVTFTVHDQRGNPRPSSQVTPVAGGTIALDMGFRTRIDLPVAADRVTLLMINTASPGSVAGFDINGRSLTSVPLNRTENTPELITLQARGMRRIDVIAPQNEARLLSVCYQVDVPPPSDTVTSGGGLRVRYLSGSTVLHDEPITGAPGAIVEGEFSADLLTAIEFSSGNAVLIDICYDSVRAAFRGGWRPVERCPQPIYLPVRHPNYPASGSLPTNQPASEVEALGRVRYGNPNDWSGGRFDAMHDAMRDIVIGGPGGPAMNDVGPNNVPGVSSDPAEQNPPHLTRLRPMNYLVMGSLYAPIAQILGLYWADDTAQPGTPYDYLIVADLNDVGHHNVNTMLVWLNSPALNFTDIDAWICFDRSLGHPAALSRPTGLRSYSLPGTTSDNPDGTIRDMTCNAGLTWTIPLSAGKLLAQSSIMYVIRRAFLGGTEPPLPVPANAHQPITDTPQVVTRGLELVGGAPAPPPDWPDITFCYIDNGLREGWYSYRVNGVDLFGRYSGPSVPAAWHQWAPRPDPRPWYYDDALGNGAVNPHAISLLDKLPPPPPTAVEAFALDPEDPDVVRDAAHQNWFASLSPAEEETVVGLRVRWLWTYQHMRQAPDTREFRVYYRDGQPNVFKGRVTSVAPGAIDHSTVTTDIAHGAAVNAFVECYVRTGGHSFRITGSSAASPLVLTVLNNGPDHTIAPETGGICSVTVPPGHSLYLDLSRATRWAERVRVVDYDDAIAEGVAAAPEPGTDTQLAGEGATVAASVVTLPAGRDISAIRAMHFHLYLSEDTARPSRIYRVLAVDSAAKEVTVDGNPNLTGGVSGWELGVLVRRYELFLPVPGDVDREGVTLSPSMQVPVVHAVVGVTAADDKNHTADDPARAGERWGDRTGNESRVGGPATVFRVHRVPPPAVQMPEDSDSVFASRANYHGKSYYTFRWIPIEGVDTHVFRAMDQSIYQRDWMIRATRSNLSGSTHERFFPSGWNLARRNAAAAELNAIDGPGDYAGLSADAIDVLGRLPGNEGHRSRGTLNAQDWLLRRTRSGLGAGDLEYFPPQWNDVLKRGAAADLLNAINSLSDYNALTNDANRVLAGLPGNETAFQQITDRPLPNAGAQTANRLGPDNPQNFPIDAALRAHIDPLDGRSTNIYFYRAAFIDAAQNIGPLGLSSPPVHMPDVMPPRTPVFTRVLAGDPNPGQPGDRRITLRWASNREPDVAGYRVYRTDTAANARDIRLMELVHETAPPPDNPANRPAEVTWLDDTVLGLVTYYYRLVALDSAGNQSVAAKPIAARAYDTALPEVPELEVEWVELAGNVRAEISWNSPHQVMIQRREGSGNWLDLAQWREPGERTIRDPFSDPTREYRYRALVRKYTGALQRGAANILEPQA